MTSKTLQRCFDDVKDFHKAVTKIDICDGEFSARRSLEYLTISLKQLSSRFNINDVIGRRMHLIIEEASELCEAFEKGNEVDALDAATDLLYVIMGVFVTFNWDVVGAWNEVQMSNMSKEKQVDDIESVRVRKKGPNYIPPNFAKVLGK